MPRFARRHPRVRELVERRLAPLFLVEGSVNALCERLNEALRAQEQPGVIYPNRVHGLFNEDDGQSVNEGTLTVLERAAEAAWTDPVVAEKGVQQAIEKFRTATLKQAGDGPLTFEAATAAAKQLGYPAAVASCLIERAHLGLAPAD